MPDIGICDSVIYGDPAGRESPALVVGVHDPNKDIMHPWLSLVIVDPNPDAVCEVRGVKNLRQTTPIVKVAHKLNAGPGEYWREDTSTPRIK